MREPHGGRVVVAAIVCCVLLGGCTSPEEAAHNTLGGQVNALMRQVDRARVTSVAQLRKVVGTFTGATIVRTADNPLRGGRSAAIALTATRRQDLLHHAATAHGCLRVDLPGSRVVTARDWHVDVPSCGKDAPLAPELPAHADRTARAALARQIDADAKPTADGVLTVLRAVLPAPVKTTVATGKLTVKAVPRPYHYRGQRVVAALTTAGADCLATWVWAGNFVVWHSARWPCHSMSFGDGPSDLLQSGQFPEPDASDKPLTRSG